MDNCRTRGGHTRRRVRNQNPRDGAPGYICLHRGVDGSWRLGVDGLDRF